MKFIPERSFSLKTPGARIVVSKALHDQIPERFELLDDDAFAQ